MSACFCVCGFFVGLLFMFVCVFLFVCLSLCAFCVYVFILFSFVYFPCNAFQFVSFATTVFVGHQAEIRPCGGGRVKISTTRSK